MELLQKYSIAEIVFFFVAAGISVKSFVTFWDWSIDRLSKVFKKETQKEKEKNAVQDRLNKNEESLKVLFDSQQQINNMLSELTSKVDLLLNSDKDDIKAYITREHHAFCYHKGWIDDYSLDCIERRYEHYVEEKGNSFIEGLMEEIRSLPKQPPKGEE